ncbi:MAG: helicase-associated domain-containing protein [Treponema sp.]|nr:helicase-associated domain-containing protein [Candidatus Treponema equi]
MKLDPKVERILEWRESFSSLPDDYFFDIIHMYLGEIKTPYNKPKLIEELSTILRKKENRETLIGYLDETDVKVLTAVRFIPDVDIEKLEKFFVPAMGQGDLYEEIASLEERLIIYTRENKTTGKKTIAINPHLEEELESVLDLGNLIAEEDVSKEDLSAGTAGCVLSPQIIAVFISYILAHPDFSKTNGDFKKKADNELKEICGIESTEIFKRLFIGMRNLVLIREMENDKGWELDWNRLEAFASLPFASQAVYLCVAGAGKFSRRVLVSNAGFFASTLEFAHGKYFTREKLFAVAFLIKEKSGEEDFSGRRFSRILAGSENEPQEYIGSTMIEAMIDSAVAFGLMSSVGTNSSGSELIYTSDFAFRQPQSGEGKVLSVDTGFTVTIMPGLNTAQFLSLVKFLDAVRCDVAATFEITRQSIMRGFDLGHTRESIESVLMEHTTFAIPQNLKVSLEEWALTYGSASLYRGYVLKLSEDNAYRAENNPLFNKHILEVLAPGVYLLDFTNDMEAQVAIQKTGIDFTGRIKSARIQEEASGWPVARGSSISLSTGGTKRYSVDPKRRVAQIEDYKNILEEMETTRDQKDGLLDRISRRIIIEPQQLRPESVRFELMEAFGMNFTGKVHVLESAIQKNSLVEIELTGSTDVFLGMPKGLVKNTEIPVVFMTVEDKETKETSDVEVEIAKISRVKRIRNSLSLRKR